MSRATLIAQVLRRLGDTEHAVWTGAEITRYLEDGYLEMATRTRAFWDQMYLENRTVGFSVTQAWELEYAGFNYGVANCTCEDERPLAGESVTTTPGMHTSPAEIPFLAAAGLLPPATETLPDTLLEIERATWDEDVLEALMPADARRWDSRYETTRGPVIAYLWRQDGERVFRHVRVPASAPSSIVSDGTWGALRDPSDVSADTVSGTWGVPRRLSGHHPLRGDVWGLPRRVFTDDLRTKIEHWREGLMFGETGDVYELPDRYVLYLRDYALAKCLGRSGPGQDMKIAQWYGMRWERGLARMIRRLAAPDKERTWVMGGSSSPTSGRPPRPSLPWAYPRVSR